MSEQKKTVMPLKASSQKRYGRRKNRSVNLRLLKRQLTSSRVRKVISKYSGQYPCRQVNCPDEETMQNLKEKENFYMQQQTDENLDSHNSMSLTDTSTDSEALPSCSSTHGAHDMCVDNANTRTLLKDNHEDNEVSLQFVQNAKHMKIQPSNSCSISDCYGISTNSICSDRSNESLHYQEYEHFTSINEAKDKSGIMFSNAQDLSLDQHKEAEIDLTSKIENLRLQKNGDVRNPIIVCEDVDNGNVSDVSSLIDVVEDMPASEESRHCLAVPAIDILHEQLRPPISDGFPTQWLTC